MAKIKLQARLMSSASSKLLLAAASVLLALHGPAPAALAADAIEVNLDQAKIIELPESTSTIIIGNPLIVDVTMLKSSGKVVLTGKGFGETNLLAVDRNGVVVSESSLRVSEAGGNIVVQRGTERESYHCNPRCLPTTSLGDAPRDMGETANQINTRNTAQTSATRR